MKKFWLSVFVLTIATVACQFGGNSRAEKLANQADQLVETEKYNEAIELYNQVLSLDPNSSHAYAGRGTAYRFLGKTQLALDDLNKAIQLDERNYVAYRERGMIFYFAEDYQAALEDCNKAVSLNSNYARGYLCLGYIQEELGNYEEAISQYTNTIRKDPNNQWAYGYRGRLYFVYTDDLEQAIKDLTKAIQLDPQWDEPYVYRGYSYIFANRYQDAINDLDAALSLASDEKIKVKAYRGLGVA
ncbi:MAG: tetratricopeptide repeat protein, partial [Chloroflexota bacterium]